LKLRIFLFLTLLGSLFPSISSAGYSVQQSLITLDAGQTQVDHPLTTNVASLDRAYVLMHNFFGHTPGANAQVTANDGMVNAYLWENSGTSTIRFERASSSIRGPICNSEVYWQP